MMHPDKTVKKKKRVWYDSATLEYGPECLIIPLPTRKNVVEMKSGRNLVVSFSLSRKVFSLQKVLWWAGQVGLCVDLADHKK